MVPLPSKSAVVVCDMWDAHHCVSAAARAAELAPRIDTTIAALRGAGSLIVHAPAGCMGFYREHPARLRALRAVGNPQNRVAYGYKWWLYPNPLDDQQTLWAGNGFGGQFPVAVPGHDLILVLNAWNILPGTPSAPARRILERILRGATEVLR